MGEENLGDIGLDVDDSALDTDSLDFSDEGGEEQSQSYYDRVIAEKKYKDQEELAKAYYNADKHIGEIQEENQKMRDYYNTVAPWIAYGQMMYEKEQQNMNQDNGQNQNTGAAPQQEGTNSVNTSPDNKAGQIPPTPPGIDQEEVKRVVAEMVGSQVTPISADVASLQIKSLLTDIRADKENFPHMDLETEKVMGEIAGTKDKYGRPVYDFPLNKEGITGLYNMAVGKNLNKIIEAERTRNTDDVYNNLYSKSRSFAESDRAGSGGTPSKALEKQILDSILSANVGKSQI